MDPHRCLSAIPPVAAIFLAFLGLHINKSLQCAPLSDARPVYANSWKQTVVKQSSTAGAAGQLCVQGLCFPFVTKLWRSSSTFVLQQPAGEQNTAGEINDCSDREHDDATQLLVLSCVEHDAETRDFSHPVKRTRAK